MPFQDEDEVAVEQTRTPSGVEKVFRKIFIEDWSLKLLSLGITLVLWLVVTGQNEPVNTHVNIQLNFIRPQSLEISNDPPKTVEVTLSGSRSKLDNLSAPDLIATIDITDLRAGERMLRLSERAQLSLPHGVRVLGFSPSAIPVRLEPLVEKEVPVAPRVEGKPAEGFEIYSTTASPVTVTVRGPSGRLNLLDKASTETIWLAGQKDSFTASNVAIDVPDSKIELLNPAVSVRVELGERRMEKVFSNIPVSSVAKVVPHSATITVLGITHDVETLKPEDLKIVLNDALEPHLELPVALQGRITLKSITPAKFTQSK